MQAFGQSVRASFAQSLLSAVDRPGELPQFIGFLVKAQTTSVRLVSNYRSLISLLLAISATEQNNSDSKSAHERGQIIQQLRQVADEIGTDASQCFPYLLKLAGALLSAPSLIQYQQQLQSLRAEVDAVLQDGQGRQYLYSPLLFEYAAEGVHAPEDAIGALGNTSIGGKAQELRAQLRSQEDEIASLQQHIQLLQDQVQQQQQQLDQARLSQSAWNGGLSGLQPAGEQTNVNATLRQRASQDEVIAKLEAENQLLRQNVADLRKTLTGSQTAEKAAQNVLEVLKDSMGRDKSLIQELLQQKQHLQDRLTQFELRGVDQAHIEAIQLGLKQVLSAGQNAQTFIEGNDSRSVQRNIAQVSQVIADFQKRVLEDAFETRRLQEQLELQRNEAQKLQQALEQTKTACRQQLKDQETQQADMVEKARQDATATAKKELREVQDRAAKMAEENKQLRETAEILQLQLQTVNNQQNEHQLKAHVKNVISQLKKEAKEVEDMLDIQSADLDFGQIKKRVKELLDMKQEHTALQEFLLLLLEQQEQIEKAVAGVIGRD